jgi:hypothetical protein
LDRRVGGIESWYDCCGEESLTLGKNPPEHLLIVCWLGPRTDLNDVEMKALPQRIEPSVAPFDSLLAGLQN